MMLSEQTKKILIIPAVALGILVFILMIKLKKAPKQLEIGEQPRAVRIIPATEIALITRAVGYGTVQSGQTWEAVAEVSGTLGASPSQTSASSMASPALKRA